MMTFESRAALKPHICSRAPLTDGTVHGRLALAAPSLTVAVLLKMVLVALLLPMLVPLAAATSTSRAAEPAGQSHRLSARCCVPTAPSHISRGIRPGRGKGGPGGGRAANGFDIFLFFFGGGAGPDATEGPPSDLILTKPASPARVPARPAYWCPDSASSLQLHR